MLGGLLECLGKIIKKRLSPGKSMRLEYGHYFPSPVFFTGGLQRCTDFPRMMGVIIDYDHAVQERLTEPALDSTESHERVFDIFHIKLLQIAYRNDSQ